MEMSNERKQHYEHLSASLNQMSSNKRKKRNQWKQIERELHVRRFLMILSIDKGFDSQVVSRLIEIEKRPNVYCVLAMLTEFFVSVC